MRRILPTSLIIFLVSNIGMSLSVLADTPRHVLSDYELNSTATNPFASGELPLGDGHYSTEAPRKGYIYLCRLMTGGGGAQQAGPWIHGSTWNIFSKPSVLGSMTWSNAQFSQTISDDQRDLSGNGLPINHPTGQFPIARSDPAYNFDHNPNSISVQDIRKSLPRHPVYNNTPSCMGGEVGMMLNGVLLFNGFDAELRDAAAHEVQDSCNGHAERNGRYHYHSLSRCIKNISVKTVLGYALDGFPITGPVVAEGRLLTTADLDECHGITSDIIEDGQKKTTYHYVMTQDFPYSVGCFRGTPIRTNSVSHKGIEQQQPEQKPPQQSNQQSGAPPSPPTVALSACFRQSEGAPCNFTSPRGDNISGTCRTPPAQSVLACVPAFRNDH